MAAPTTVKWGLLGRKTSQTTKAVMPATRRKMTVAVRRRRRTEWPSPAVCLSEESPPVIFLTSLV